MIKIYDPGEDGKKDAKGRKYHSAKPKLIAIEYLDKIKKSDLAGGATGAKAMFLQHKS